MNPSDMSRSHVRCSSVLMIDSSFYPIACAPCRWRVQCKQLWHLDTRGACRRLSVCHRGTELSPTASGHHFIQTHSCWYFLQLTFISVTFHILGLKACLGFLGRHLVCSTQMKSESHWLKELEPVSNGLAAGRGLDWSLSGTLKSDTRRDYEHCPMIFLIDHELCACTQADFDGGEMDYCYHCAETTH